MSISPPRPVPRSTYRLQLSAGFGFEHAIDTVPYLRDLGVSHLYLSPVFDAVPGSTHGYDVTDPTAIRPELGGTAGFDALSAAASAAGLGIILDIVPNHMATSHHNPWWYDVMRRGRASEFASYFDIDWDAHSDGRLVLPVLGSSLEQAIENHHLVVDGAELAYFDARFPLSPESAGAAADSTSSSALHALLDHQHYRLMYWQEGLAELNYRRFFDVSGLVGVRVEDPEVFAATHRLILELIKERKVTGLRVDHVDGLKDPTGYLRQLRTAVGDDTYLVVEKILAPNETLPRAWPVDGTTGYESLNRLNGVFVGSDGLEHLARSRIHFTWNYTGYEQLEHQAKVDVADQLFRPEMERLAAMLCALIGSTGERPISRDSCFAAVRIASTSMESYRTYVTDETKPSSEEPATEALIRAQENMVGDEQPALVWISRALSLDVPAELQATATEFRDRWQQLTGPVVGKGLEDTAFYRYAVLTSLNEVGGGPVGRYVSVKDFHRFNEQRSSSALHSLNATSTHDTKRSEDVRARINVISELAGEWTDAVRRWSELNSSLFTMTDRGRSPSAEAELLFYQSLFGVFPLEAKGLTNPDLSERLKAYMLKAAREAKQETNWLAPDSTYEQGLESFVEELLTGSGGEAFRESFSSFAGKTAFHGMVNSLGQLVLKLAIPGVPDIYQGSEVWDYSLVDPDNRRPVDFENLRNRLSSLGTSAETGLDATASDAYSNWQTGNIKQLIVWRGLALRNGLPGLFQHGGYLPLNASGPRSENICAFARQYGTDTVIAVVTRLSASHGDAPGESAWAGTTLDVGKLLPGSWQDAITGNTVRAVDGVIKLNDAFGTLPVALLQGYKA